jgi:hypothetical protein
MLRIISTYRSHVRLKKTYREGSGPRPLLLELVGLPGGLGEDPSLGNEDHMLPAELLLQLTHQPGQVISFNYMLFDATSYL